MQKNPIRTLMLLGALIFSTASVNADPQASPAAPRNTATTELDPKKMGKQFEQLLLQMAAPGKEAAKKVYGIDLDEEFVAAQKNAAAGSATPSGEPVKDGEKILKDVFDQSTGIAGTSMKILGKMAEADLAQLEQGDGQVKIAQQTENARKAEELVGQGTLKALGGDSAGSIPLFQQAIALNPEFGTAWYNLACAYARQGAADKFIVPLRRAIAIDGKYRGMADRDSDFDAVRKSKEYLSLAK
jgi:tetratricopeptide (TPR) repeat protein